MKGNSHPHCYYFPQIAVSTCVRTYVRTYFCTYVSVHGECS
jgi:hypothetical protein